MKEYDGENTPRKLSQLLKVCRKQHLNNDYFGYAWTVGFTIKPKGQIRMIDVMYNYR